MQFLVEFFGFTTPASSIWNVAAYAAFVGIIIGVSSERYRNILFTIGAGILALYAGIFLHNPLFTALQTLVVISGLLQLAKVSKRPTMVAMVTFTIAAYILLVWSGAIVNAVSFVGSFGLLGIAFGLAVLPRHYGFLVMAVGGALLVVYAFTVAAWVFFFLNIFFAFENIRTWYKGRPA